MREEEARGGGRGGNEERERVRGYLECQRCSKGMTFLLSLAGRGKWAWL